MQSVVFFFAAFLALCTWLGDATNNFDTKAAVETVEKLGTICNSATHLPSIVDDFGRLSELSQVKSVVINELRKSLEGRPI